jgi:hypothetical protein
MGWHIYQSARAAHFSLDHKPDVLVLAAHEVVNAKWNHAKDTLSCEGDSEPAQQALTQAAAHHVALLRDIFGNPFRPVTVSPAWQSPTIVALAQAAYDERDLPAGTLDPARLAVLADALEEAGCTEQTLLDHLRGPGPHVRGCWAVDLVLGKS